MRSVSKVTSRIGLIVLLIGVALVAVGYALEKWRAPTKVLWDQISVGDTETTVLNLLGDPYLVFDRESAPTDYYINGYGKPQRPITGKVLIYLEADMVLYIWLSEAGTVEEVFRGTS